MLGYLFEHFFFFFFREVTRAECRAFRKHTGGGCHLNFNTVQVGVQQLLRAPADRTCRELIGLRIRAAFPRIRRARTIRSAYFALNPSLRFFRKR